jgi:hypothetical protein
MLVIKNNKLILNANKLVMGAPKEHIEILTYKSNPAR